MINATDSGWRRVTSGLDVQVHHGVPIRVNHNAPTPGVDEDEISSYVHELTGLTVSMDHGCSLSPTEREWLVCVSKNDFPEVLRRLALASAALYVDRFHKPLDSSAVDWNTAEFSVDFNHAIEHCCIDYDSINKKDYFDSYVKTMSDETIRLIQQRISPLVDPE